MQVFKKFNLFLILLSLPFSIWAQLISTVDLAQRKSENISSAFIKHKINLPQFLDLKEVNLSSEVKIYNITKDDVLLYPLQVKVITRKNGNQSILFPRIILQSFQSPAEFEKLNSMELSQFIPPFESIVITKLIWQNINQQWHPALLIRSSDGTSYTETIVLANGTKLSQKDRLCYHHTNDSLFTTMVFNPDPLTTANVNYGNPYSDQNDADVIELNNERVWKTFNLHPNGNGGFAYKNAFAQVDEFSNPIKTLPLLSADSTTFTRSEEGFEAVNTLYHITEMANYFKAFGYGQYLQFLDVDVNGFNGADQSAFSSVQNPSRLIFGEGGVDDAEDADVIIHEYGHALMDFLSPDLQRTGEIGGLSEGFSDYLAVSYSREINPYKWENVFSWDGHNEFWFGRKANKPGIYPTDLVNNLYADGELWASTLMEIWDAVGKQVCDHIIFESIKGYMSPMTMKDAAELILLAEADLYQEQYQYDVCMVLKNRGFVDNCLSASKEKQQNEEIPQIFVSKNQLSIDWKVNKPFTYKIINQKGQTVETATTNPGQFINIENRSSGVYFIEIPEAHFIEKVFIP